MTVNELASYSNFSQYYDSKKSKYNEITKQLIELRIDIDQGTPGSQEKYNDLLQVRKFLQGDISDLDQLQLSNQ